MNLADLAHLPPTLDGHQAAEVLGCSYWSLLEWVKRDECPVAPIRLGRSIRFPTVAVLRAIGIDPFAADTHDADPTGESPRPPLRAVGP